MPRVQDLQQRMQASANRVLTAVDWPPAPVEAASGSAAATQPAAASLGAAAAGSSAGSGELELERFASAPSQPMASGLVTDTDSRGPCEENGGGGSGVPEVPPELAEQYSGGASGGGGAGGGSLGNASESREVSHGGRSGAGGGGCGIGAGGSSGGPEAAHRSSSGGGEGEVLTRWARQLAVFRFAAQDWTERFWQVRFVSLQRYGQSIYRVT